MKIIKYIFLLSLLTVIAFSVYITTLENQFNIQINKTIKVPKAILFSYINNYKNWEKWDLWGNKNSKIKYNYSNKTSGLGASYSWVNKDGIGKMETIYIKENDSLVQQLILNETSSKIYWKLKDTLEGTKVIWNLKGEVPFRLKVYSFFRGNSQEGISPLFEKGLDNLDTEITAELSNYNIEVNGIVLYNGSYFLHQATSCNIPYLKRKQGILFYNIIDFFKKNDIPIAGTPFSIYHVYDTKNNEVVFSAAIPVTGKILTANDSDYISSELSEFSALKTTLRGDYSHSRETFYKAYTYLNNPINKIEEAPGKIIEVFLKGPWDTQNPSEWITEVYIPVRKRSNTDNTYTRSTMATRPALTIDSITTPSKDTILQFKSPIEDYWMYE